MSRWPLVANLTVLILTILVWPLDAQQNPFTQDQITKMVQAGLGDDSGSKLVEQRGIDFVPSEDFIQTLKTIGASEAFLAALHAFVELGLSPAGNVAPTFRSAHADLKVSATKVTPEPASPKKPINQVQVFALLVRQVRGISTVLSMSPTDSSRAFLICRSGPYKMHYEGKGCERERSQETDGCFLTFRGGCRAGPGLAQRVAGGGSAGSWP